MPYSVFVTPKENAEKISFGSWLVTITSEGEEDAIVGLLSSLTRQEYPVFLEKCTGPHGGFLQELSFMKGPFDDDGVVISENMVMIFTYDDELLMPSQEFHKLCKAFGETALEAAKEFRLLEKDLVDEDWISRVKEATAKI